MSSNELERAAVQYRALLVGLRWIAGSPGKRTVDELREYAKNVIISTRLDTKALTDFVEESEKYADQFFGPLEDLFPRPTPVVRPTDDVPVLTLEGSGDEIDSLVEHMFAEEPPHVEVVNIE